MTTPTVSTTTSRVFQTLPPTHTDADGQLGYPLLRYLSLLADQAGDVETLLDRLGDGTSDLTDPTSADLGWLRWLGQLVGADLSPVLSGQALRDAVFYAPAGYRAGTKQAIADAAKSALTGAKYAAVYDHSKTTVGDGGVWDVLIVTRVSDTPDQAAVLAAVVAKKAKPAGVVLYYKAYSATYAQVQGGTTPDTYAGRLSTFPTYQSASDYLPPGA